jgi:hypothetical protein
MGRTVRELEGSIDSREITEWMAYNQLDPIPDSNWQTGLLASVMVNLWSKTKAKPEDFIPRVKRARRQSIEEMCAVMKGLPSAPPRKP